MNYCHDYVEDNDAKKWFEQWLSHYNGDKNIKISSANLLNLPALPAWYDEQGVINPILMLNDKVLLKKINQYRKEFVAIEILNIPRDETISLIYQKKNARGDIVDELSLFIYSDCVSLNIAYTMSIAIITETKEDQSFIKEYFYAIDTLKNSYDFRYKYTDDTTCYELMTSNKALFQVAIMGFFQLFCHRLQARASCLYPDYYHGIRPVFESLCQDSDVLKQFKNVLILGYIRQSMMGHYPTISSEFIHRMVNTMISPLDFFMIDDGIPFKRFDGYLSFFHQTVKNSLNSNSNNLKEKNHCCVVM